MPVTPNMNLDLPVPSVTPGPDWADSVNEAFDVVDTHDHTSGNGVPVPTAGISIDADLSLNSSSLIAVDHVNMDQQSAALGPSVVDSLYDVNGDLYFNNGAGTPVQVTVGNAVNVSSSSIVPSGVIWPYGGSSAPNGFLLCNGSAVSRSTYSDLFLALGTTYGSGDGTTTFNIPDMIGRAPIGAGTYTDPVIGSTTRTLGQSFGSAAQALLTAEMPAHAHGGGAHNHQTVANAAATGSTAPTSGTAVARARSDGDSQDYILLGAGVTGATIGQSSSSGTIITSEGSGSAHNNMQPVLVTNYIIKY